MNNIEPIEIIPIATSVSDITFEDNGDTQMKCIVEFFTTSGSSLGTKVTYLSKEIYDTNDVQLITSTVYSKLGIQQAL